MPPPITAHHLAALLIILHLAFRAYSQNKNTPFVTHCSSVNFTASSPYESNLRHLLSDLVSSTPTSVSYFSLINSTTSPSIYGLAQCRPDVSSDDCAACLNNTASTAPRPDGGCPLKTSGSLRSGNCLLIYSNQTFYTSAQEPIFVTYPSAPTAPSVSFTQQAQTLMNSVMRSAAEAALRFAVGNANDSEDAVDIFAMGWCSMDLSTADCSQCLHTILGYMPAGKKWGISATVSCEVKFDTYQFYDSPKITAEAAGSKIPAEPGEKNKTAAVAAGVSGTIAFLLLSIFFVLLLRRRKRSLAASNIGFPVDEEVQNVEIKMVKFSAIKKATNNFAGQNKLGRGGFGPVYKGVLNGQEVAVKRLSATSKQGLQEMKNEIQFVANLRHRNLVRLLGYCLQREEKILIYEFLPNTSLDKFLYNPVRKTQLDWETRLKIIVGVARGLLYLHEDSLLRIVHRDLKASNILLDSDMNPKISDFGLAKLFKINETERNTSRIAGTLGYMAPEYVLHGLFSIKSDVFSYGVLVLEIITGMEPRVDESEEAVDLKSYVWQHWREGKALEVVDRSLEDRYSAQEVLRCVQIGLLCVQEDQLTRPKMGSVVTMLSSSSVKLESPSRPALYNERTISVESDSESRRREAELLERGTVNHRLVLPGTGR